MSDTSRRILFVAEIIVLALPCFVIYLFFGSLMARGLLWGMFNNAGGATGSFGPIVMGALILPLVAMGFVAIWNFFRVSTAYLSGGAQAARRRQRAFYIGALLSALPLMFLTLMGLGLTHRSGGNFIFGIYVSGLPILAPALHLWFEILTAKPEMAAA